jgi:hypothetical protein
LVQGIADAAALSTVFDHYVAHEAAARGQASAHGIIARQHPIKDERHVLVFAKLEDSEHATACSRPAVAWSYNLLGQGKNSRLAGDEKQAVRRLTPEPSGPAQAPIVKGAIKAMPCQRFGDDAS